MSALALGTAHLLRDETESIAMIRYAIDHGVNYLDVAYIYDAQKRQTINRLIGKALADGYRQKVKIAVSLPVGITDSPADFDRCLHEQLDWLGMDCIDFAVIGWLDRQKWPGLFKKGVLDWVESAMAGGRIGNVGFSFHDDYQTLRDILNSYDEWALCQFQFSYMDIDHHPGIGGIRLAAEKGLAVVVSEPLKGGRLTGNIPDSVAETWGGSVDEHIAAEWGLRWVWHHPEVATVISDVSTLEQLKENIALADDAVPDSLSIQEQILVNRVRDAYRALKPVPCTACRGCMPCPQNVDIPRIFELYNDAVIYNAVPAARKVYLEEGHHLTVCDDCGRCEQTCGRHVPVRYWLDKARRLFSA